MDSKFRWMMIVCIAVAAGIIFLSVAKPEKQNGKPAADSAALAVTQVTSAEFAKLAKDPRAFVVDVHTPEQTHIPGTDAFIAYDSVKANADRLPQDKSTPILVYCRSGNMSAKAAADLAAMGYTHIYDLKGGTNAYKEHAVSVALTPESTDLGTVIYGDVAHTAYTLTNYTPLPLKVTRVSTSCGCTKAKVAKETLGAYESTSVDVSFDPAVHKDLSDLGALTRTIYIDTDNPNFPEVTAMFHATVVLKPTP